MIRVLPLRADPEGAPTFNVTTRGPAPWRLLSPMLLGPVNLVNGVTAQNVENAWQYSKVYPGHHENGFVTNEYWHWAFAGWKKARADRYPMGKGAKPDFSLWDGEWLGYIEARKQIYVPLYRHAVISHCPLLLTELWRLSKQSDIVIQDFDAYDHRALGYSWTDVLNDPDRKMGHGFVLAMILEGAI